MLVFRRLESLNCWSLRPVVECRLAARSISPPLESDRLLREWEDVECPPDRPGAMERLRGVVSRFDPLGWLVGLAAELQLQATGFRARSWSHSEANHRQPNAADQSVLALECESHAVAEETLRAALRIIRRIANGESGQVAREILDLQEAADSHSLFECDRYLIREARRRKIPLHRIDQGSVIQLGEGVRQRRMRLSLSSGTSLLASQLANDKLLVKSIWSRLGLPIPAGRAVTDADDAVAAADELGGDVVVKPRDADYGNGVSLRLRDPAAIRVAYDLARQESEQVLVERFLEGTLHRLLVIGGELVSAIRREPAAIVGDGIHTIAALIERENGNPQRGPDFRWPLQRITLGSKELATLTSKGLNADSVPGLGEIVRLRDDSRIGAGGMTIDVTAGVHPHTRHAVLEAVGAIGLDIAGVDLVATDIAQPLESQNGGLLEVNEEPALYIHLPPICAGANGRVARAVVQAQYPSRRSGYLPAVVAVGDRLANRVAERFSDCAGNDVARVGSSTPLRTRVGTRLLHPTTSTPGDRWRTLVLDSTVRRAALAANLESLVTHGLGLDRMRTLVLADSSQFSTLPRPTQSMVWRWLLRAQHRARFAVVNLDDPLWGAHDWSHLRRGILVSTNPSHPALWAHRQREGLWGTVETSELVVRKGEATLGTHPLTGELRSDEIAELLMAVTQWTLDAKRQEPARDSLENAMIGCHEIVVGSR
ncbi:MAG: hypothetical protein NT069_08550 [Planctomycetota bacterium]|nr:hypothetical protein [Planctomycetota bacterium]